MTTEELREMNPSNPKLMEATKVVPSDDIVLDEEDEFLRELRELAGMEETPAAPIGAENAGKATAPVAPAEEPEPEPEPVAEPVEKKTRRARKNKPELAAEEAPAEEQTAPEAEAPVTDDEDDYFFAGWQKGLMLLVASASILVLTVLAVLNALQI